MSDSEGRMGLWRITFITADWDEPSDTVLDVTWQAWYERPEEDVDDRLIEADSENAALKVFLAAVSDSRREFYDEEGCLSAERLS